MHHIAGPVFCGICGSSSVPCCGCRDFTSGGHSENVAYMVDPVLLERSQRRWALQSKGMGRTFKTSAQNMADSEHYSI